jgi:hypothetical protein
MNVLLKFDKHYSYIMMDVEEEEDDDDDDDVISRL